MSGLQVLEEIRNLCQEREKTEFQIAEKYNTTKDNIVYILMNPRYNNGLLTKKSSSPIAKAYGGIKKYKIYVIKLQNHSLRNKQGTTLYAK